MRWRLLFTLLVVGLLVVSASIASVTVAQDANPVDPIVEALGDGPFETTTGSRGDAAGQQPRRTTISTAQSPVNGQSPSVGDGPADDPEAASVRGWIAAPGQAVDAYADAVADQHSWITGFADNSNNVGTADLWANLVTPFGQNSATVELTATIDGERVRVTLNGQPVPNERLKRDGSSVTVLDGNGRNVATITIASDGRVTIPRGFSFRGPAQWSKETTQRKVIGIRTGNLDPALSEHLQLANGEGILIASVVDGQPAARAGLKAHDVIVAIDGVRPANLSTLRDALAKVGDNGTVRLTVVRAGQTFETECGVTSVSAPLGRTTVLPRGSYTLSTTGGQPTSLFWQRDSEGDGFTISSQGTTSFAPGITPLPGGRFGQRGNVVTDPEGRPLPIRSQRGGGGLKTGRNSSGTTTSGGGGGNISGLYSGSRGSSARGDVRSGSNRGGTIGRTTNLGGGQNIFAPGAVNSNVIEERTKEIEKRLERLEKLLEQLVEQKSRDARATAEPVGRPTETAKVEKSDREGASVQEFFGILFDEF